MPNPEYFQRAKKTRIYYDPLGNVVKTINPDNSMQATVRGKQENITAPQLHHYELPEPEDFTPTPWESFSYDANDLAPITHEGQLPAQTGVLPTHYFTPKSATVDPLGRTVKTTEHKSTATAEDVVMKYEYDIRGNLKKVTDALDRTAFSHVYDLRPKQKNDKGEEEPLTPVFTWHIDKGISKLISDALGKPIETIDAKGAQVLSGFDTLSRPIKIWAKDKVSETPTLRQLLIYGDSAGLANPENNNLKGKLYKHYDEAGVTVFNNYDFKGNAAEKTRQVITDEEILTVFDSPPPDWQISCYRVNWLPPPGTDFDDYADSILDTAVYQTNTEYDALNRVTKLIYPEDVLIERKELEPVYNKARALEKVTLDGDTYVERIAYNAKGQRLLISFGNGVMTRYCYDKTTFRLARLKSEKYIHSQVGKIHTYAPDSGTRQDYGYKYDLAGNIIKITDKTPDSGVTANPDELIRNFSYDPLYRLLSATGRECNTPATNPWDDIAKCTDINDRRLYTQKYSYDKMGNMLTLQNIATSNTYTREFNYTSDNNYLNSIDIGVNNYAFTFDENGNQVTENSSRKFEWDYADKLRCFYNQAGTSEPSIYEHYLYDGQGNRTKKLTRKSGGNIEVSIYIDGILDHQYHKNSSGTVTAENNTLHIMDDKSRIANLRVGTAFSGDTTPEIQYNLEDHLGSSNVRIDENGTVIDRDEFYPFGETSLHTFDKKRYRYVGKERDEYSGMYYYGARYYAAWTCRFVSVDPLADDYMYLTPYNYAGNRPIISIDLDGMQGTANQTDSGGGGNTSTAPAASTAVAPPTIHLVLSIEAKSKIQAQQAETNNLKPQGGLFGQTYVGVQGRSYNDIQKTNNYYENQIKVGELNKFVSATQPILGGGNGFGIGLAHDPLIQGAAIDMLTMGAGKGLISGFGFVGKSFLTGTGLAYSVESRLFWTARAESLFTNSTGAMRGLNFTMRSPVSFKAQSFLSQKSISSGYSQYATLFGKNSVEFGRRNLQISYNFQTTLGKFNPVKIGLGQKINIGLVGPQKDMAIGSWFQFYSKQGFKIID